MSKRGGLSSVLFEVWLDVGADRYCFVRLSGQEAQRLRRRLVRLGLPVRVRVT